MYEPHGPREECGVVGIWAPGAPVARLAYVGGPGPFAFEPDEAYAVLDELL